MATELRNHIRPEARALAIERSSDCNAAQISEILLGLQLDGATGVASIEAVSERGVYERSIIFKDGLVMYAGEAIPTPYEFVSEIAQHLHIGVLETVLEFAAKRTSIQSVLQAMVEIGVLKWPDIAVATRKQALVALAKLPSIAGNIVFVPGIPNFDLRYCEGVTGFNVDALLLEIKLLPRPESEPPKVAGSSVRNLQPVILSVDDSPIVQTLIRRMLGRQYRLETCSSVFSAFKTLSDCDDIALVLLDLNMPNISGLEFCHMLRKIERYKELPIIMLTARDGIVDRVRGHLAGATHYLTKPVKAAELKAVVSQYVVP